MKVGLIKYGLEDFAGSMLIRTRDLALLGMPSSAAIGFLSCAALSILLGILFVYLIQLSGFRLVKSKGVLYGFILWFLIYGGARAALCLSYIQDDNPTHTIIQLFIHLLFGLILGIIVNQKGGSLFSVES